MDTQEVAAVDLSRIEGELVKQNVTKAVLAKLKEDFLPLDKEITTKEEREAVHRAEMVCKNLRTLAVATCKKGREQAIAEQRAWISKEKEVVGEIEEVELKLKARKKDFDSIEEWRMQEAAQAWANKVNERKQALFDAGFTFNGTSYVLDNEVGGEYTMTNEELEGPGFKDVEFGQWIEQIGLEVRQRREIKAEEEAKKKEAEEALLAAQREAERKAKELEAREAALNAKVNEGRKNELLAIGASAWEVDGVGLIAIPNQTDIYRIHTLHTLDDASWAQVLTIFQEGKQAEIAAKQRAEQERLAREEQLRKEAAEEAARKEQGRVAQEEQRRKDAETERLRQEAEELARRGDKGQAEIILGAVRSIPTPEMTSDAGKALVGRVVMAKTKLIEILNEFIQ